MTSSSLRRDSRPCEDTLAIPSVPFRCTSNDTWRGDVDPQRRLPERALESVDGSMRTSIARSGVSISFEMVGSGESVTLIHGVGSNLESWENVLPQLAARFHVLRYDLRGHGQSGKPPGPYALDDFVQDLRTLLDRCAVDLTRLVGFSFGGLIAQAFTLRYPDRVRRLALLATVAGRTPAERRAVMARAEALVAGGATGTVEAALERWYTPEFRSVHPEIIAQTRERVLRNDPAGYAAAYRVFAEGDLLEHLDNIRCPTLIATGEHDAGSTSDMARRMHEKITGSQLVVLPRYRHGLLVEAADDVARLLCDFLVER
jgi:pimeloyl-ACP methyl ester carboxylesterase